MRKVISFAKSVIPHAESDKSGRCFAWGSR
ncbi:hypothetical protein N783_01260 [Pontibacillus marinus BH030004 = DSM 16465]|uniref:Uncharacterized protein n=1 Tax=Pontibacillus marinus BH030004 = DSM 16465 TaxID=1385511 RepID=A0A0A5GFZ8_9BACI|nr:hypothetical protein N783_01260 [Pontibacillus marinus BH030004 = DSM 16465]